jgi:hypothetical protein
VTTHANSSLRRHLWTIFNEGTCAGLSDGQLLEQFATKTGPDAEPAFTLLIERLGPMVFRVCRCDLEACSLEEAARQLGWPIGTVKSRLNRGRQRLRDRLVRRGLAPGLAVGLLSESGRAGLVDAAISPILVEATMHALTKAETDANLVSNSVTLLTQTVLRTMFLGKLKVAVASLFIVGPSGNPIRARCRPPRKVDSRSLERRRALASHGTK